MLDLLIKNARGARRNKGVVARGLRDLSMGLVQAFPAERGRLEAVRMLVSEAQALFGVAGKE